MSIRASFIAVSGRIVHVWSRYVDGKYLFTLSFERDRANAKPIPFIIEGMGSSYPEALSEAIRHSMNRKRLSGEQDILDAVYGWQTVLETVPDDGNVAMIHLIPTQPWIIVHAVREPAGPEKPGIYRATANENTACILSGPGSGMKDVIRYAVEHQRDIPPSIRVQLGLWLRT